MMIDEVDDNDDDDGDEVDDNDEAHDNDIDGFKHFNSIDARVLVNSPADDDDNESTMVVNRWASTTLSLLLYKISFKSGRSVVW